MAALRAMSGRSTIAFRELGLGKTGFADPTTTILSRLHLLPTYDEVGHAKKAASILSLAHLTLMY